MLSIILLWKVKEMVLALLSESDLALTDDVIESIIDKVLIVLHFVMCCILLVILPN